MSIETHKTHPSHKLKPSGIEAHLMVQEASLGPVGMALEGLHQLPNRQFPQLCPILGSWYPNARIGLVQPYRLCTLPMVSAHLSGLGNSSRPLTELLLKQQTVPSLPPFTRDFVLPAPDALLVRDRQLTQLPTWVP